MLIPSVHHSVWLKVSTQETFVEEKKQEREEGEGGRKAQPGALQETAIAFQGGEGTSNKCSPSGHHDSPHFTDMETEAQREAGGA